jgi:hypothetical protein
MPIVTSHFGLFPIIGRQMSPRSLHMVLGATTAAFFAVVQFRLIAFLYQVWYGRAADAAHGVFIGMPHWRTYQSRVLGPYIIEGLAKLFPSYLAAYIFFTIVALAIAGFLAWLLGRQLAGATGAWLAFFTYQALFALNQTTPWIYAWDYLSAILFLTFVLFVVMDKSWVWFAALFFVAVLNRENAEFMALWMIIDPLASLALGSRKLAAARPLDLRMIIAGAVCLVAGIAIAEFLRRALFIQEVGPQLFRDNPHEKFSSIAEQFQLGNNVGSLVRSLTVFDYTMPFLVIIEILAIIALAAYMAYRRPAWSAAAVMQVGILAAIMLFGVLLETRLYIELLPFVVAEIVMLALPAAREASSEVSA